MCIFISRPAKFLVSALLVVASGGVFADTTEPVPAIATSAQLIPLDDAPTVASTASEVVLYSHYNNSSSLTPATSPRVGSALTFAGSGPQISITRISIPVYSLMSVSYERVHATLQFWERYNAAPNVASVFSTSPPAGRVEVDLIGPFNLNANTGYLIDATLAKPLLLDGYQARGVSLHLTSDYGGGLVENTTLVAAFDTGPMPPASGAHLASFAEGQRDDFNFGAADAEASPLAIKFFGTPQKLTQCSSWSGHHNYTIEEFDDSAAFPTRWNVNVGSTGGSAEQGAGSLTLSGGGSGIPYVTSVGTLSVPPSGEFSVRWLARYLRVGAAGDGLVVSKGLPTSGSGAEPGPRALSIWQDNGGFRVTAITDATQPNPAPAFQETAGANVVHDIEYCWLANTVEVWVDGVQKAAVSRNANLPRPDSMWFGNPVTGPSDWNNVQVFRVHVRKPVAADTIYFDSFE
ncbi:MAG: hypothetical protein ABIS07_18110 [Dokdonella sp.]